MAAALYFSDRNGDPESHLFLDKSRSAYVQLLLLLKLDIYFFLPSIIFLSPFITTTGIDIVKLWQGRGNSPCSDVRVSDDAKLRANRVREEQRSHMVSLLCKHLTSPHLSHQLMDEQTEKEKVKKVKSLPHSVSVPPSLLPPSTAAHYAWLLNRRWCMFMSQSHLMC